MEVNNFIVLSLCMANDESTRLGAVLEPFWI